MLLLMRVNHKEDIMKYLTLLVVAIALLGVGHGTVPQAATIYTGADFDRLIKGPKPVLVDFYADY